MVFMERGEDARQKGGNGGNNAENVEGRLHTTSRHITLRDVVFGCAISFGLGLCFGALLGAALLVPR